MGRLIGYMANRADRLRAALHQERHVLGHEKAPSDSSGWGIGFYHGDEVLHKKRPMVEGEIIDWESIVGDVDSDCALLHMRQPTVGDFRAENAHPFRMRSWNFAHRGTIANFDQVRSSILEKVPDFLRRNIRGNTDSELFFHLLLASLHEANQIENPDVDAAYLVPVIKSSLELIETRCAEVGKEKSTLSFLLTNGRSMIAFRQGFPMAYVEREGLHDPPDNYTPPPKTSAPLRYVMIVSGAEKEPRDFQAIPERSLAIVDRNLSTHLHQL